MSEAKKILEMIESVKPDDGAAMHEIDVFVSAFVNNLTFSGKKDGAYSFITNDKFLVYIHNPLKYTRLRDALKAIRPDGFIHVNTVSPKGNIWGSNQFGDFETPALPTEELAELHAIIQAIQWEDDNAGNS